MATKKKTAKKKIAKKKVTKKKSVKKSGKRGWVKNDEKKLKKLYVQDSHIGLPLIY